MNESAWNGHGLRRGKRQGKGRTEKAGGPARSKPGRARGAPLPAGRKAGDRRGEVHLASVGAASSAAGARAPRAGGAAAGAARATRAHRRRARRARLSHARSPLVGGAVRPLLEIAGRQGKSTRGSGKEFGHEFHGQFLICGRTSVEQSRCPPRFFLTLVLADAGLCDALVPIAPDPCKPGFAKRFGVWRSGRYGTPQLP